MEGLHGRFRDLNGCWYMRLLVYERVLSVMCDSDPVLLHLFFDIFAALENVVKVNSVPPLELSWIDG